MLSAIPIAIEDMTTKEKIGQLLMVHFNGNYANEEAELLIKQAYVGGFIYYNWANGLDSPLQVSNLSNGLQKIAQLTKHRIPLLIAVDQEGGRVQRLKEGFTSFPSNQTVGSSGGPLLARVSAEAIGRELKAVGMNMNLAPVADVNSNPNNPVIGSRSFGDNPQDVSKYVFQAIQGYNHVNIISVMKHFPGHGDVIVDSHFELPKLDKSIEALLQVELYPFIESMQVSPAIMTAHILLPQLDPINCVTLSPAIITGLLRERFGYKGVIITDSLVMQSVLNQCDSIDAAVIKAIQAGCDIILLGGKQLNGCQQDFELTPLEVLRIHARLVQAVNEGEISLTRLNESVDRILSLKSHWGLDRELLVK